MAIKWRETPKWEVPKSRLECIRVFFKMIFGTCDVGIIIGSLVSHYFIST